MNDPTLEGATPAHAAASATSAVPGAPDHVDVDALLPSDDPVRLLETDGTLRDDPHYPLDLGDAQLRELYELMVVTRAIDQEGINLQRQGQLSVYPSGRGQEAQVGMAYALDEQDWIFPSYRELGAALVRKVDPRRLMQLFRGTWLADHDPYERNFALLSIPIATQVLHATGFAMGARLDDNPIVVMACLGDGATSEGDTHEAMTFAGVTRAPVVFYIQNNQYAISVPVSRQTAAPTLAHKAVGYGLAGRRCDGNDVLATYAVTRQAVARARAGDGGAVIEAMTYRMEAHTTSDDATRYRSAEEVAEAAANDPIARMRALLVARELADDVFEQRVEEHARDAAAEVRAGIFDAAHDDPMELFEHVYVDRDGHFDEQIELLRTELKDGGA